MIYTPLTMKAMKLAYDAHDGQMDRSGAPYVFHPFHVAEKMKSEKSVIVALLHDVPEETKVTLEDIRKAGFGEDVMVALRLLQHDKNVPYLEYIKKLKNNDIAREVKMEDIAHNCDPARVYRTNVKIYARFIKYGLAIEILREAERNSAQQLLLDGVITSFVDLPKEKRIAEIQISAETIMQKAENIRRGVYTTISGATVEKSGDSFTFEDSRSRITAQLTRMENGEISIALKVKDRNYMQGQNPNLDGELMGLLEGIAHDIRNLQYDATKTRKAVLARNKEGKTRPLTPLNPPGTSDRKK